MKIKIKKTNSLNNQMVLRPNVCLLVCVSLSVSSSRVGFFSLQHLALTWPAFPMPVCVCRDMMLLALAHCVA